MKTDRIQLHTSTRHDHRPRFLKFNRRNRKKREHFKDVLDGYVHNDSGELEEYSVRFPRHNRFWDNGYEDVS